MDKELYSVVENKELYSVVENEKWAKSCIWSLKMKNGK